MIAIVKVGGRQYRVSEGDTLRVHLLQDAVGGDVELGNVLVLMDGDKVTFGAPFVEGARVSAEVVNHGKEKKIRVFKYKPKKRIRTLTGHRQQYTTVKIKAITAA